MCCHINCFWREKIFPDKGIKASFGVCPGSGLSLVLHFSVNVGEDCPVFDGLFEFCQLSAGGSAGESTQTTPCRESLSFME